MKEIDHAKKIFLTDVDEETKKENLDLIVAWENDLMHREAYQGWKSHDITVSLNKQVKQAYIDHAVTLATNRALTDEERASLWAKQDACIFILNLTDQDAKSAIDQIRREVRTALNRAG